MHPGRRQYCARVLAGLLVVCLANSANARKTDVEKTRIGSNVQCMIDAQKAGDSAEFTRCSGNGLAVFDGPLVELQLHIRPGVHPAEIDGELFIALGGRAGVRGIDTMLAWLPMSRIERLVKSEPRIAFVQMPQRPIDWTGKVAGQGGTILRTEAVRCTGIRGNGITVAVVDSGFAGLDKSKQNKEVPKIVGKVSFTGGSHGTMCAEVVAEVAPSAAIRPVATPSLPVMQAFIAELTDENKYGVDIVSHSVGWLGMSFGRHTGPLCKVTDMARAAGVAWVNASGNNGGGNFYQGVYRDVDFDGNHDVLPGEAKLLLRLGHNAKVQIYFDWDDYEKPTLDLDLLLFRQDKGFFKLFSKSVKVQSFYSGSSEIIAIKSVPAGIYAVVMHRAKGSLNPSGVRLRILNKSTKSTSLSVHHKNGNVYDPASCKGVLAVGALRHNRWLKGPLETYSSYGPTVDGRQKPEIVAPTGVQTSIGAFFGTSAACPHVAGALALYAQATEGTALDAIDALIEDAQPMGLEKPDVAYGNGRLFVRPERLGWRCDVENIELPAPCTSSCGTVGKRWCGATCGWHKCVAPWETCNGVDDDCDGLTDELQQCQPPVGDAGHAPDVGALDGQLDAVEPGQPKPAPLPDDDGCAVVSVSRNLPSKPVPWLFLCAVLVVVALRRASRHVALTNQ